MPREDEQRARYEQWVREFAARLYRCALRMTGQPDVAEELVQETFYHAWRSIGSLRDPDKARGWLLQILRHRYAHWVRDERRRPRTSAGAERAAGDVSTGEDTPADVLARQESLQGALNALEDRYKLPFILVFLEGMTCQEVGKALGIPLGTVLSRIHRARQFLRRHLTRDTRDTPAAPGHSTLRIHKDDERDDDGGVPGSGLGGAS